MSDFYEKEWDSLYNEVKGRGANAEALVSAMRDYYTVFEDGAIEWLARLYEHKTGGFYYSNSARDNETVEFNGELYPLMPDIESTYQAFGMLKNTMVIKEYSDLPYTFRKRVGEYVCSLEDEKTGYFYNPQWPKALTDSSESRRGRDLNWAHGLRDFIGLTFPYPTARERGVQPTGGESDNSYLPEHFRSRDAFVSYLDALNWDTDAYYAGNLITSQVGIIKSVGLSDACIGYLSSIQNKETGLWGSLGGYLAANAYLKISSIYSGLGYSIPNTDRAALSILDCATSEESAATAAFQYNVFYSLNNILLSLDRFGGEQGEREARTLNVEIINRAPAAIRSTKEKTLKFKRHDGSFSYFFNRSSHLSQRMPVAIKDTEEGDVNATALVTGGTVRNVYQALGLIDFKVPLFSPGAYELFVSNLDFTEG